MKPARTYAACTVAALLAAAIWLAFRRDDSRPWSRGAPKSELGAVPAAVEGEVAAPAGEFVSSDADRIDVETADEVSSARATPSLSTSQCRVTGRVVDDVGQPVTDVRVFLSQPPPCGSQLLVLDETGRFEFAACAEGDEVRTLNVFGGEYGSLFLELDQGSWPASVWGSTHDLGDLRVDRCGRLVGRVRDRSGAVAPGVELAFGHDSARIDADASGVEVILTQDSARGDESGVELILGHDSARSDELGRFEFARALPGRRLLTVDTVEQSWTIEIAPGRESSIDLELDYAGFVAGWIVDTKERPVANAVVKLASAPSLASTTGTDGRFHVLAKQYGKLRLEVTGPGFRDQTDPESTERRLGDGNLRIVVEPATIARFVAKDARTGAAIEPFTARLTNALKNGKRLTVPSDLGTLRARIDATLKATLGVRDVEYEQRSSHFVIKADGYIFAMGEISDAAYTEAGQVVMLDAKRVIAR